MKRSSLREDTLSTASELKKENILSDIVLDDAKDSAGDTDTAII